MSEPTPTPTDVPSAAPIRQVAAFDFDGTLARRDTLMPFLAKLAGAGPFTRATLAQVRRYRRDRDAAKADLLRRLLTGRNAEDVETFGHDYAVGLHHLLRPEMMDTLRDHRAAGHELVIVSASLGFYLRPLGETLGIDHVISVEMAVEDGRLTGELAAPNVRGPEKIRRLRGWLGDDADVELWAYGDSSGDRELLDAADHATWIGRKNR